MKKKLNVFLNKIAPNKNLNLFIFLVIIIGVIFGTLFFLKLGLDDKKMVTDSIVLWKQDINSINFGQVFINSFFSNFLYLFLIYIFGISLIGIIVNIFLVFFKGFVVGFNISTFVSLYGFKGILFSFEYVLFSQILLIISIFLLGMYSLIFSFEVISSLIKKKAFDFKLFFRKYNVIFLISLGLVFISSLFESFLFPILLKLTS